MTLELVDTLAAEAAEAAEVPELDGSPRVADRVLERAGNLLEAVVDQEDGPQVEEAAALEVPAVLAGSHPAEAGAAAVGSPRAVVVAEEAGGKPR